MKRNIPTVLAISPARKCFGIAVFVGSNLIHFARANLGSQKTKHLRRQAIRSVINDLAAFYQPDIIVIRAASQYQSRSTLIGPSIDLVETQAANKRIKFVRITLQEVRAALGGKKITQKESFGVLAHLYPELAPDVNALNASRNRYYFNVVAAVSVGLTFLIRDSSLR